MTALPHQAACVVRQMKTLRQTRRKETEVISTRNALVTASVCLSSPGHVCWTTAFALRAPNQKKPPNHKPITPAAKGDPRWCRWAKRSMSHAAAHLSRYRRQRWQCRAGPDNHRRGSNAHNRVVCGTGGKPESAHADSTMPAFAQTIKGKEMTALATYLASLKGPPLSPPAGECRWGRRRSRSRMRRDSQDRKDGALIATLLRMTITWMSVSTCWVSAVTDKDMAALSGLKGVVHLDLGQTSIHRCRIGSRQGAERTDGTCIWKAPSYRRRISQS